MNLDPEQGLAVHTPVNEVKDDIRSREYHAGQGVDGMGILNDTEAPKSLFLCSSVFIVQGKVNHHSLLLLWGVFSHIGGSGVARQAVGVGLAVGPVQHHGPGVGHATATW